MGRIVMFFHCQAEVCKTSEEEVTLASRQSNATHAEAILAESAPGDAVDGKTYGMEKFAPASAR